MSDLAKTVDQLEQTISSVTYAANTNQSTVGDITALFVTLRQQAGIHSGLPVDSPLRDGTEPETVAAQVEPEPSAPTNTTPTDTTARAAQETTTDTPTDTPTPDTP